MNNETELEKLTQGLIDIMKHLTQLAEISSNMLDRIENLEHFILLGEMDVKTEQTTQESN